MNEQLIIKSQITINAPAQKVWNALINPDLTKKYMFGCEVISNFKVGSPILWQGLVDDKEVVFVKGNIVGIEPEKYLAYTTFDPNSKIQDIPENYLTVAYRLAYQDGGTSLSVTHGDFNTVAEGKKRYQDTMDGGGWESILQAIKNLIEAV